LVFVSFRDGSTYSNYRSDARCRLIVGLLWRLLDVFSKI
jgi:hypothetical protein